MASVVFFACITPWLVRNYQTFGKFIFIRDNFGAELRLGNGNGADGTLMLYLDATHDPYAMRQFQAMGELPYIAMRKQQALDYIHANYGRFAMLSVRRFVYFWAGPPKDTQPVLDRRGKEFAFSGCFGADVLGIGARAALAYTGRVADVLAVPPVPGGVLLCVLHPALPASD